MDFERKTIKMGEGSVGLTIPIDLAKYLDLGANEDIVLREEEGKHGKYVSFWKKTEQSPKNDSENPVFESI